MQYMLSTTAVPARSSSNFSATLPVVEEAPEFTSFPNCPIVDITVESIYAPSAEISPDVNKIVQANTNTIGNTKDRDYSKSSSPKGKADVKQASDCELHLYYDVSLIWDPGSNGLKRLARPASYTVSKEEAERQKQVLHEQTMARLQEASNTVEELATKINRMCSSARRDPKRPWSRTSLTGSSPISGSFRKQNIGELVAQRSPAGIIKGLRPQTAPLRRPDSSASGAARVTFGGLDAQESGKGRISPRGFSADAVHTYRLTLGSPSSLPPKPLRLPSKAERILRAVAQGEDGLRVGGVSLAQEMVANLGLDETHSSTTYSAGQPGASETSSNSNYSVFLNSKRAPTAAEVNLMRMAASQSSLTPAQTASALPIPATDRTITNDAPTSASTLLPRAASVQLPQKPMTNDPPAVASTQPLRAASTEILQRAMTNDAPATSSTQPSRAGSTQLLQRAMTNDTPTSASAQPSRSSSTQLQQRPLANDTPTAASAQTSRAGSMQIHQYSLIEEASAPQKTSTPQESPPPVNSIAYMAWAAKTHATPSGGKVPSGETLPLPRPMSARVGSTLNGRPLSVQSSSYRASRVSSARAGVSRQQTSGPSNAEGTSSLSTITVVPLKAAATAAGAPETEATTELRESFSNWCRLMRETL